MKRLILALALVLGLTGTSRAQDADFQKRLQQEIIQLLKDMDGRIQKLEDKTVFKGYQQPPSYSPPSYYSPAPTYASSAPPMLPEERFVMTILLLDQWLGRMDRQLAGGQPGYTPRTTSTAALMRSTGDTTKSVVVPPRQVGGTTAVTKKSSLDLGESKTTPGIGNPYILGDGTVQRRPGDLDENRTTASPTTPPQKKSSLHLGD